MRLIGSAIIAISFGHMCVLAQNDSSQDLARLLSSEQSRDSAVAKILEARSSALPLLLSWTRNPPPQVERDGLYVGLADAFARLRATQAIPFLIKNISLQRWLPSPNIWLKTPQVVEERLPAAAALIQIGPEASKAIIHTSWDRMGAEDRLAAIFVVSRIKGVPEARAFLLTILGQANLEHHWADEGLKTLDGIGAPAR